MKDTGFFGKVGAETELSSAKIDRDLKAVRDTKRRDSALSNINGHESTIIGTRASKAPLRQCTVVSPLQGRLNWHQGNCCRGSRSFFWTIIRFYLHSS